MAERTRRKDKASAAAKATIQTTTVRSKRILSEDKAEVEFEAEIFESDPAYVRVSHGVTKSIGDYESLRIDVAITVPCYLEMIEDTAKDAGETVAVMMEDELDAYGLELHGSK